ncbi:MAG: hypothetical protein L0Y71_12200 [Gemmataceae bacterium]|nr:hypothetical protein [Gemmataceae bacterium]
MRRRRWWLGVGVVCAGMGLGALGQLGWGQSGDLPPLAPPATPAALPAPPAPSQDAAKPVRPGFPAAVPVQAEVKLPPPPTLPLPSVSPPSVSPTPSSPLPKTTAPEAVESFPRLSPAAPAPSEPPPAPRQDPHVSVEWVGAPTARLNMPMNCQILVRNHGSAPVHNVMVRHRLSPGVTCRRTEPLAVTERDDLVWTIGSLGANQQRRLELQLVCNQRGPLNCAATVSFAATAGQQVQVREPLLHIKVQAPPQVVTGETFNLGFVISNPGDGVAEGVKVKAVLAGSPDKANGRIVELPVGSLAPKESRTFQIPCTAKSAGTTHCRFTATGDGDLTAAAEHTTAIVDLKLDLTINGPKLRYIDRHTVYKLKVGNPSVANAPNVMLREIVPPGFKFHAASGGRWDEVTKSVTWQIGDLAPGQSREVTLDLIAAAPGEHQLTAQVASTRGVRSEASTVTRVEGLSSLVMELVDVDDPVEVGAETAYEVRVTNAGTKMETNLELRCTLPEEVELKAAKSIAGVRHRVEGREVIFDALPRLAPKADVIYRITVRGQQAGDARFRARIRADGLPESVLREEATRFYNDR